MRLSPSQEAILRHLLRFGDDVPGNIGEEWGFHRTSISRSMPRLEEKGFVEPKGNGVWKLTNTGILVAQNLEWNDIDD